MKIKYSDEKIRLTETWEKWRQRNSIVLNEMVMGSHTSLKCL